MKIFKYDVSIDFWTVFNKFASFPDPPPNPIEMQSYKFWPKFFLNKLENFFKKFEKREKFFKKFGKNRKFSLKLAKIGLKL